VEAGKQTYAAAGVSIEKGDAIVERLRAAAESTGASGFGGHAKPGDEGVGAAGAGDACGGRVSGAGTGGGAGAALGSGSAGFA